MTTRDIIIQKTTSLFAKNGYENFSMRTLAQDIPLAQSVIYHYFPDKDSLLRTMFETLNTSLGQKRRALVEPTTASDMLMQRIEFQLDNAEAIVAVLKYYLAYRRTFMKFEGGFVPDKSSLHIEEVLTKGLNTGEFYVDDLKKDAKVITHAVNGFLLEYYPDIPKGKARKELCQTIHNFLIRALMKGGELHEESLTY